MILGEGIINSVGELLLTRKISTPGSYYLLVYNDPGSTYFRGVIIDGYTGDETRKLMCTPTSSMKPQVLAAGTFGLRQANLHQYQLRVH